jgi:AAA domain
MTEEQEPFSLFCSLGLICIWSHSRVGEFDRLHITLRLAVVNTTQLSTGGRCDSHRFELDCSSPKQVLSVVETRSTAVASATRRQREGTCTPWDCADRMESRTTTTTTAPTAVSLVLPVLEFSSESSPPPPLFKFVFTGGRTYILSDRWRAASSNTRSLTPKLTRSHSRSQKPRTIYTQNVPAAHKTACGGKTTALARAFTYLRERGFEVISCPEVYTLLSSNGLGLEFFSTEGMGRVIQRTVLDLMIAMEDGVTRVLRARGKPAVILCDRGTMDNRVYLPEREFASIMEDLHTDLVELRDHRYDAVFHLVTAADGAPHYYSLENNKVRTETAEEAIAVDKRTQRAWVGHPHLYVIDNSTEFEAKMSRLVDTLSKIVGLPSNLKRRSAKFLLASAPDVSRFPAEIDFQEFEVEKIYLQQSPTTTTSISTGTSQKTNYSFIRRRTNIDSTTGLRLGSVYQHTAAHYAGDDELIEQKRIISEREYAAARQTADPCRHVVRQRRISFLYDKQSFAVHRYLIPVPGLCILQAQVEALSSTSRKPEVNLPPFLVVERRILDTEEENEKFGAYSLSIM